MAKSEVVEENHTKENDTLTVEPIFDDMYMTTTLHKNTTHEKQKNDEKIIGILIFLDNLFSSKVELSIFVSSFDKFNSEVRKTLFS